MHAPPPPVPAPLPTDPPPAPETLETALLATSGGDALAAERLLYLAWEAYVVAGLPLGPDEEGLAAWWAGRLQRLPR